MKKTLTLRGILTVLLVVLSAGPAWCASEGTASSSNTLHWRGFTLDAGFWGVAGRNGFETGEEHQPKVSKLEYPMNGIMLELRGAYAFPILKQRLSVRGRLAQSAYVGGTSKDTDYNTDGSTWNYSESDSEASVLHLEGDIVFLQPFKQFSVGGFIGYGSERSDYEDSDLVNTWPEYYTVGGVNATYDVTFSSVRLGLLGRWQIIKRLAIEGEIAGLPYVRAEADAVWKLRNYPFSQEATGYGVAGKVRVVYSFTDNFGVYAGFRGTYLMANHDGTMSGTLDGVSYSNERLLREITSEYFGGELGVRTTF
jgi:hypothetical protein